MSEHSTFSGDRHQDKWNPTPWLLVTGLVATECLGIGIASGMILSPARALPIASGDSLAQANFEEFEDFDYWENLCNLLAASGETEDALAACEHAIELEPKESRLWAVHSGVLLASEQYPQAIASAEQSLTFNEENSLALTYQCMAYAAMGQNETALDKCNAALRLNGDWGTQSPSLAWRFRGIILDQDDEYEQALVAYDRTLLLEPNDSLTWLYRCEVLVNLREYRDAIENCTNALEGDGNWAPENPGLAWYYQGLAFTRLGDADRAIAAYDRAVSLTPGHAPSWIEQGWVLQQLDRPTEALTSYTRAVELAPESSRALVGQCATLNQTEQYEAALEACKIAIQGDGHWWDVGAAQAWNQQSHALAGMGNYDEALAAANRAVGIAPTFAAAWSDRSVVLWYLEDYESALDSVNQALTLDPNFAQAWGNQARIYRSLGELWAADWNPDAATRYYQQSLAAYTRALELHPDNAQFWANQSVVYWFLRDYDNALTAANQALYFAPTSAQAFQNRGAALVALNQYEAACQSYQRAIELEEENADAWASLGVILVQMNDVEAGQEALERAISLNPEQPLARDALAIIESTSP